MMHAAQDPTPITATGQPRRIAVSSLLMQDTLASGGLQAGTGENHVALFANPFRGGKEEALLVRASGELDYLQRDPASSTGWSQAVLSADYPADAVTTEVVVVVHPVDLSVWALAVGPYVTHEDIRVRPARLTSQTVDGVTTCSWQWLPLAIPIRNSANQNLDHISRLRVAYDGTVPHVIGIDKTGKGVIDIRPNFSATPGGEYFQWSNVPYSMTLGAPDSYQWRPPPTR